MKILSDKIIINFSSKKNINVEAYGKPTIYFQTKSKIFFKGKSEKIEYKMKKGLIILTKKAYIQNLKNIIKSNKIIYSIYNKKIKFFGNNKKTETTLFN